MITVLDKYMRLPLRRRAALWFVLCNVLQQGARVLMMPALTRLMPAEQYGVITVFNSWTSVLAIFVTFSLSAGVFNKAMSLYPSDRDRYVSSMMGLSLFLTASTFIFALLLGNLFERITGLSVIYLPFMWMTLLANIIFGLWAARKRYDYDYKQLLKGSSVFIVLSAACSVLAVAFAPSSVSLSLLQVGVWAVASLAVSLVLLGSSFKRAKVLFSKQYWVFALKFNIPLIPHYLSQVVLGQIDRVMIANMVGNEEAAIYAVAYQISIALMIVNNALNSTIVPWLYSRFDDKRFEGVTKELASYLVFVCALVLLLAMIGPEIIGVFAPPEYSQAIYIMPPVCASMIFMFMYYLYGSAEFYFMKNKFTSVATCLAAAINVILNYALIPVFGFIAAGYTTFASYLVMALLHTVYARRITKNLGLRICKDTVLWSVALVSSVLTIAVLLLYDQPVLRWLLLLLALIAIVAFRKKIAAAIKRKTSKENEAKAAVNESSEVIV